MSMQTEYNPIWMDSAHRASSDGCFGSARRKKLIMKLHLPIRFCLGAAFVLLFAVAPALARGPKPPSPLPQPAPRASRSEPARPAARPAQNQEHIPQWMASHSNLPLAEQQRALEDLPGFHELPPQTQQHYRDQLARFNSMNSQQRARMLERNEALEHMTPPQRQQWNSAMQQLSTLSAPRRQVVVRAILDLREMPPNQRQSTLNSPAFRDQFSGSEFSMLSTILTAEPYIPHPLTPAP